MNKFLLYKLIPAVVLLLFIVIMISGTFLRDTPEFSYHIPGYFPQLKKTISRNQWDTAVDQLGNLQSAWRKMVQWIQFSVERDEINNFQHSMARFKGYLEARDRPGAFAELEEMKETWNDLGQ